MPKKKKSKTIELDPKQVDKWGPELAEKSGGSVSYQSTRTFGNPAPFQQAEKRIIELAVKRERDRLAAKGLQAEAKGKGQTPPAPEQITLERNSGAILKILAVSASALTAGDIFKAMDRYQDVLGRKISKRKIEEHLRKLEDLCFVSRPYGLRSGWVATQKGIDLVGVLPEK